MYEPDPSLVNAAQPALALARRRLEPATVEADVQATAAAGFPAPVLDWKRSTFGVGIGATGLEAVDLDGDGELEIVAAAGRGGSALADFWYVLRRAGSEYVQSWVSPPQTSWITRLLTANVDSDAAREILLAVGGQVQIYDGASLTLQSSIATAAREISAMAVADADSDGELDLVVASANTLYVHSMQSGAETYEGAGYGGYDLAVGNVDADANFEIVVGKESQGWVIDAKTHAVEWTSPWGFGSYVRLGDLDADGKQEVVAGYSWYLIRVFDVEIQNLARAIPVDHDLDALKLIDVDGDATLEIVYGDAKWGGIHILNGSTGAEISSIPSLEDVTDVAVGDVDADGDTEILWGAGYWSSTKDQLYVYDLTTRTKEWESLDINGPFYGLSWADLDGDGRVEFLSASPWSDSGYRDGLWFVHDLASHALEYQSPTGQLTHSTGPWRIQSANVDADPQLEIFAATTIWTTGHVICYDGITHQEQWRAAAAEGIAFRSMKIADVDGDGALEVVGAVEKVHTGAPGTYVYVYDAATGALEWQSPSLGSYSAKLSLLRIGNVDDDPNAEIVVGEYGAAVFVVDGITHTTQSLGAQDVTALELADWNHDGVAEIIVGTTSGSLRVIDPTTGAIVTNLGSYGGQIDGLAVLDLTADGVPDFVFAVSNSVYIYDGASGERLWTSGVIGTGVGGWDSVGALDSLTVADMDADGTLEIAVNIGQTGFHVYRVSPGPSAVSIGNVVVNEGAGRVAFQVSVSPPASVSLTVSYETASGSAAEGDDFTASSGTLAIPPGQSRWVEVALIQDLLDEPDESFFVRLSAPSEGEIGYGEGVGTIIDDDVPPTRRSGMPAS